MPSVSDKIVIYKPGDKIKRNPLNITIHNIIKIPV